MADNQEQVACQRTGSKRSENEEVREPRRPVKFVTRQEGDVQAWVPKRWEETGGIPVAGKQLHLCQLGGGVLAGGRRHGGCELEQENRPIPQRGQFFRAPRQGPDPLLDFGYVFADESQGFRQTVRRRRSANGGLERLQRLVGKSRMANTT